MIFKNKIIKLPDGDNLSLYALNEKSFVLYLNKDRLKKKKLILENIIRCENLNFDYNGEFAKQISANSLCLCFDGNISIVNCENDIEK